MPEEKQISTKREDANNDMNEVLVKSTKTETKNRLKAFFLGGPFLILLNVLAIGATIFFIISLSNKANELKRIKNEILDADKISSADIVDLELKSNLLKSNALLSLFPDESGLVRFISEIEQGKARGVITDFYFANQDAVRDKTGNFGVPFVLQIEGTWEQIDQELQDLQKRDFIIRTITFAVDARDSSKIRMDYGGFIYVDDRLGKTK